MNRAKGRLVDIERTRSLKSFVMTSIALRPWDGSMASFCPEKLVINSRSLGLAESKVCSFDL